MTILSNIAHSGNPETPRKIPDWLQLGTQSKWQEFDIDSPVKNEIYVENFNNQNIELRNEKVEKKRLNNFALFNELVDDLEADRKSHCQNKGKKSPLRNPVIRSKKKLTALMNSETYSKKQRETSTFIKPSENTKNLIKLSAGYIFGKIIGKSQIFQSVPYAKHERFEPSTLYESENNIDTDKELQSCPFSPGNYENSEDCLKMSIIVPESKGSKAIVKFLDNESYDIKELGKVAEENDRVIFLVNLRRGVFGYLHEKEGEINPVETDLVNALRFIASNLEYFDLRPDDVDIVIEDKISYLLFDLIFKLADLSILQESKSLYFNAFENHQLNVS